MPEFKFEPHDITGHSEQIKLIGNSLRSNRTANAYLFLGQEGIGKKLLAHSFAGALFCSSEESRPCGSCPGCKKMRSDSHLDFYFIGLLEKRKNIVIDQIRELRDALTLKSFEGGWKAVIIDQAELMNDQAQNCLLKTLEEPSADTVIMLIAGGGGGRLLPTIISRCQILRMSPLANEDLEKLLVDKMEISEEEAPILARLADGSVGKALALDDEQALDMRPQIVRKMAGFALPGDNKLQGMLELTEFLLYNKDMELVSALEWVRAMFRDAALQKASRDNTSNLDASEDVHELGDKLSFTGIAEKFDATEEALRALQRNQNKESTVEMMLMKIGGISQ